MRSPGSARCATTTTSSSARRTRRWPARGRTAATSCRPPTGNGFDNVLLPSGYELGIDATAFAAAIATHTEQINLLLAVRMGELWIPQLARQLATIDRIVERPADDQHHLLGHPRRAAGVGAALPAHEGVDASPAHAARRSAPRPRRRVRASSHLDPPRARTVSGRCPPMYFGGFSDAAKDVAAEHADVFLTWPDTVASVGGTVDELRERAAGYGRTLDFGLRAHVIVRETEADAKAAAQRLVSKLDDAEGGQDPLPSRSTRRRSASSGRPRCARRRPTTASSRRRCGPASAGPAAAPARRSSATRTRCWPSCAPTEGVGIGAFILSGYPHEAECRAVRPPRPPPHGPHPPVDRDRPLTAGRFG